MPRESAQAVDELLTRHFKIKILPKISPDCATEGFFLHRRIGWSPDGFTWEADERHVQALIRLLDLQSAKPAPTPGTRQTGSGQRDLHDALP
eukprot:11595449-Alexandrium_andersonii.AAC.1